MTPIDYDDQFYQAFKSGFERGHAFATKALSSSKKEPLDDDLTWEKYVDYLAEEGE